MFGLELISVGLLHLATLDVESSSKHITPPAPTTNHIECKSQKPLLIGVVSAQDDVRYDFSKKTSDLNRIGQGAYSPYGDGHTNIESRGLTVETLSFSHNIKFYFEKHKEERVVCLQIQKVKVTINYTPTVYVSTKFKKGTPIFNKILEHEKEHVKITQKIIDKYKNILKERLKTELKPSLRADLFSINKMKQGQRELENKVKKITAKVERAMYQDAQKQHNAFDDSELDDSIKYNQGIARKLEKILKLEN